MILKNIQKTILCNIDAFFFEKNLTDSRSFPDKGDSFVNL